MTSQSPRIYTYKITFEEVPYYYYGVKKEKYYNQEYWGSPVTHKWCWEFYTPKKQILEFFEYSDNGYIEAQEVEKRLINPVYQSDNWCLNSHCGGKIDIKISREIGRKNGQKTYKEKRGIHGLTKSERMEAAIKGGKATGNKNGKKLYEEKKGIHGLSKEERSEIGKRCGIKLYNEKRGIHGRTPEQKSNDGLKGGRKLYEEKRGIHSLTSKEKSEAGKKGGKSVSSQKWRCLETGFITNPGNLSKYQKARGIDTSLRERLS